MTLFQRKNMTVHYRKKEFNMQGRPTGKVFFHRIGKIDKEALC